MRLTYVLVVERGHELPGDGFSYHHSALLLADGEGFIDPARFIYGGAQESVFFGDKATPSAATALPPGHREPTAGHPPAWTVLLAGVSLLGLRSVIAHQITGAVVGSLGVVMVGVLGREVRRGWAYSGAQADRVGVISALVAAFYAFLWLNDAMVMSESLVVFTVALASYCALRFVRMPTTSRAAVLGAASALAALTRAELLAYLPIVLAWFAFTHRRSWRSWAKASVVAAMTAVVLISPWAIRNTLAFDRLVLLSNGSGTVLVQANCDATYHGEKLGYWELYCGLPQPLGPQGQPLDEAARDVVLRRRGLDYIDAHRTRLLTVVVPARVGRMWGVYDPVQQLRFDILVEGRNFRLSLLGLVQYYLLLPCAIGGVFVLRRTRGQLAPLLVWPITTTIAAVTAFGETRYRVASEVVIVVLAAVALDAFVSRTAARRSRSDTSTTAP